MSILRVFVRSAAALLFLVGCATTPRVDPREMAATHYDLGLAYFNAGNFGQAVPELAKAVELNPSDPVHHNALGMALMFNRRLDEAIRAFEEALRVDERFSEARNNLASAYMFKGDLERAQSLFLEVLKDPFYPTPHFVHFNLAKISERQGRLDEAVQQYKRALDIQRDYVDAHNSLGLLYLRQGKTDLAIKELTEATRLSPRLAIYYQNLGTAYLRAGRQKEARRAFEKVLELEPSGRSADYARRMLEEFKR